jgi:hypothetical protein
MAVNLIGLPKDTSGTNKIATTVFLALHVLISLGLLIGSLLAVKRARAIGSHFIRDAWVGVVLVVGTTTAGVLTMISGSNWFSYIMAVGFLASFLLYGSMLMSAKSLQKAKS